MNRVVFALRNIADKVAKILGNVEILTFYWQTYVLSRFEKVEPDIYIVSYPKCGRTWLRVLLHKYVQLMGYTLRDYHNKSIIGIENGPVIKFHHGLGNWVPAPFPIQALSFQAERYRDKKVVFMVRDPRDVLVSSWYHLRYRERIYQQDLSTFIRDDLVGVRKIVAFMNMWLVNRDVPAAFMLLTYEQMHADTPAIFEAFLRFLDIPVDHDLLHKAVEASTFTAMKKMESEGALREPWMKPGVKDLKNSMKVRKGKVGGYRQEFSEQDREFVDGVIREQLSEDLSAYIR